MVNFSLHSESEMCEMPDVNCLITLGDPPTPLPHHRSHTHLCVIFSL